MSRTPCYPETPPHAWALTPPPTGGFKEITNSECTRELQCQHNPVKPAKKEHLHIETLKNPFGGHSGELEYVETENTPPTSEDRSSQSRGADIATASTLLKFKEPDFYPERSCISHAVSNTEPFLFLDLPLSIRNRIYTHLLVIPALICVRQKHTAFHDEKKAFLYAERRELLPGIAYALGQVTVDGFKVRFSRFAGTNINILRTSKDTFTEAKTVLYGKNTFEIIRPSGELSPPPDFSVRLFPTGCQRLVTKMCIRIHSFYDLEWLLGGGHAHIKNFYRGLDKLTLILELQSATKGFRKLWARKQGEDWAKYIRRLRGILAQDIFPKKMTSKTKVVPMWMDLRVMFTGESFHEKLLAPGGHGCVNTVDTQDDHERDELRRAINEAWDLFKKSGRSL